jgi:MFS family permease
LYAAGFVTAFGAHSIAANLGSFNHDRHGSLLALGFLLAVYDGAEVVLKPVFGALADRIGPRRVLVGGLIAFATASAAFVAADNPGLVGVARFGQGAAAAAFSPAAGAMVARLTPTTGHGRAFGGYGAWKGLGYTLGPLLGGILITVGGFGMLFSTLSVLAVITAVWAVLVVPALPALPRRRQTLLDLGRRLTAPRFLRPTLALAAGTAALAAAVGFLPVRGAGYGLGPLLTGAVITALAAAAALVQPWAGRARDSGRLHETAGMAVGLTLAAAGFIAAATLPGPAGLLTAGVAIGVGAGVITPLGFAALASTTPPERMGETMGSAEVGRELGDAGGPILVAAVATAATLSAGLVGLAIVLAIAALAVAIMGSANRKAMTDTANQPERPR